MSKLYRCPEWKECAQVSCYHRTKHKLKDGCKGFTNCPDCKPLPAKKRKAKYKTVVAWSKDCALTWHEPSEHTKRNCEVIRLVGKVKLTGGGK